ncbi:MAG: hypothetical protein SV062_08240 [Thermodesulfobacteriota bacterium]|nr:hypothetical protein [Thermodesulfobacteriota bacterium]
MELRKEYKRFEEIAGDRQFDLPLLSLRELKKAPDYLAEYGEVDDNSFDRFGPGGRRTKSVVSAVFAYGINWTESGCKWGWRPEY